jgi:ATPase subunit of ABC transporter with duplicated ATPase domains
MEHIAGPTLAERIKVRSIPLDEALGIAKQMPTLWKPPAQEYVIQTLETVENSESYRGPRVVNNGSVHVSRGEIVGLLGPNGAGRRRRSIWWRG